MFGRRIALASFAALAAVGFAGCGGTGPQLPDPVPVDGSVTMDGKPLPAAIITFIPAENATEGQGANAVTDDGGEFELITAIGRRTRTGAIPGKYKVVISRLIGPNGSPVVLDSGEAPANVGARESLPARYSDFTLTELKAHVTDDGGSFKFKVSLQ